MNPQHPGQFGQGPAQGYGVPPGPQNQGPRMYNGQPMQAASPYAGPPKPAPVQNGPQQGTPGMTQNVYSGSLHGAMQYGPPRPGGPGAFQTQGQAGMPNRPPMPAGPGQSSNMVTNQMGNLNISGGPPRVPVSTVFNAPTSSSLGMSGPSPNKGPVNSVPQGMSPLSSQTGYPSSNVGAQPGSAGLPTGGMMPARSTPQPQNIYVSPAVSSYSQPSNSQGRTSSGSYMPQTQLTSGFGPPSNSYGQPPSNFGPGGAAAASTGAQPPFQPPGMNPTYLRGDVQPPHAPLGLPPTQGVQSTFHGQQMQSGDSVPMGMEMRQQPQTSFAGMPPGPNQSGYGQPPSHGFPVMDNISSQGYPSPGPQDMSQGQFGGTQSQFTQGFVGTQQSRPGGQVMQGSMQPQTKKLDPDQMPSPIQVIEDDKHTRSGVFSTFGKGVVPPLVTTPFITQDQGNCNPAFMRCTMYNVPCTSDMLKSSHLPFALTISPFAKLQAEEVPPPIINLGELGPVRCKRCKAYINSFMMFIDGGRRFQCIFCGASTDVPDAYFAHLDHTGKRVDMYNRPELCLGSYEFVATKDYCKNGVFPNAPAFIFMIDVSYNSVKSGLVNLLCERLKKDVLVNLPRDTGAEKSEIRIGFVTYSKEIHFYNVKHTLAQPQMMVVSDIEDVFVPLLDGFLVTLEESEAVIDSLLSQIPQMFSDSRETEVILGPVIQAGLDVLKSADRSGKLYIFHTSLPIGEAPGKLKNRDDRKLLGTDKEKTILTPQSKFYQTLGQECVAAGCSVDMFLFPNSYCDVATISDICRLTSGNLYKYSYFQGDLDGDRFIEDLKNNVKGQRAFDSIVRIRTSQGIRPVDFLGNFYMSNTTDVEMCAIDINQAICVEIKHDDKLTEQDGACIQVAALYTSVSGQRRLCIHNMLLNCCTQLADLFRNCELDSLVNFLSKNAIRDILNKSPRETREHVMNEVANILACYRKNCATPSSAGQLILPECMKLLPLYGNCIIKSDGIQGGAEISTDDRSYLMHLINAMDVKSSCAFFYPRLIPLHNLDPTSHDIPKAVRCSSERLKDDGVYLLENGVSMFIWIGHTVDPEWIQKVFSVQSAAQIDIDQCRLLELENEVSHRVREVVNQVKASRNRYMKLTILRQRDKLEPWFHHFLVEDKGANGSASYVDFLCHIHKEIRSLLN